MKIAHVVGNRPQFIKLSLLHQEWQSRNLGKALIIHTGQHFHDNMSSIFFEEFQLPAPDYQLQINNCTHNEMIGKMLIGLDPILALERPDWVIVYGDTNTTLAGALAAKKRNIPLAHVEAGIRTGKEDMPEETNRYLADRLADVNFACTALGVENLLREGFTRGKDSVGKAESQGIAVPRPIPGQVIHAGDLMLDAALYFEEKARDSSFLRAALGLADKQFVLATIHRAENLDDPYKLGEIISALNSIHQDIPVVLPLHPRTAQLVSSGNLRPHFLTTPPLGYFDMLSLVQACAAVITDSGGLSREAFFFQRPSVIIMERPFWPEVILHGQSLQAAADQNDILVKFADLRQKDTPFNRAVFGDGKAATRICDFLAASGSPQSPMN